MLNRRQFVVAVAATVGCLHCPTRMLRAAEEKAEPIDCGPLETYRADGVSAAFARNGRFFLVTRNGKLFAPVARCPHEGVALVYEKAGDDLQCTEHKQSFNTDGRPKAGKHVRRPLQRLGIRLDERQHVLVDPERRYAADRWDDPASFVELARR